MVAGQRNDPHTLANLKFKVAEGADLTEALI